MQPESGVSNDQKAPVAGSPVGQSAVANAKLPPWAVPFGHARTSQPRRRRRPGRRPKKSHPEATRERTALRRGVSLAVNVASLRSVDSCAVTPGRVPRRAGVQRCVYGPVAPIRQIAWAWQRPITVGGQWTFNNHPLGAVTNPLFLITHLAGLASVSESTSLMTPMATLSAGQNEVPAPSCPLPSAGPPLTSNATLLPNAIFRLLGPPDCPGAPCRPCGPSGPGGPGGPRLELFFVRLLLLAVGAMVAFGRAGVEHATQPEESQAGGGEGALTTWRRGVSRAIIIDSLPFWCRLRRRGCGAFASYGALLTVPTDSTLTRP